MDTVTIKDNRTGKGIEIPIKKPAKGTPAIDISVMSKELGLYSFDPGFTSTISCESSITYLDGDKGELHYRGYPIENIADKKNYVEVCYLLLTGRFPNRDEYEEFDNLIRIRYFLHEKLIGLFRAMPDFSHPMATLSSAVAALSSFYHNYTEFHGHGSENETPEYLVMAQRIIAKIPTIAAYAYRHNRGLPYIHPDKNRYFTENFLYMMRAYPNGEADILDVEVKALDAIFLLHADHEQNASTTAVKTVCSTGAHPYASISAGISALWGPAHGGANEAVIRQLHEIGDVKNVEKYVLRAKDKDDPFKLMGFGHRVYKSYDPRARFLKALLESLKSKLSIDSHLLEIAHKVEEHALNDDYFVQRKLYPNVDFYSGIILTALKIPVEMFTPIFVIGRSVGWVSQWMELKNDPKMKIFRPRQFYTGDIDRNLGE